MLRDIKWFLKGKRNDVHRTMIKDHSATKNGGQQKGEGGKERICKVIHVKGANEHEICGVVSK